MKFKMMTFQNKVKVQVEHKKVLLEELLYRTFLRSVL
jgi:hypothetical protein